MWARALVAATVTLAACGRVGFTASADGRTATSGDGGEPCAATHELCEDFESRMLDASVWTDIQGSAVIDSTRAHTGSASLHVQTPAFAAQTGFAQSIIGETATLALGDLTFYVRAWSYLDALPANNMGFITAVQTANATGDLEDGYFIDPVDVSIYAQFNENNLTTEVPATLGAWFCSLWSVTLSSGSAGAQYLAGDVGPLMLTDIQTDATPPIEEMQFGIAFVTPTDNNPQPIMDLWIDDLIVDKAPLTCEEPSS